MFIKSGYILTLHDRSTLLYSEGNHKALINIEMLNGQTDFVIYFAMFNSWLPPFENEKIDDDDKIRIRSNIRIELEKKGLKAEWE